MSEEKNDSSNKPFEQPIDLSGLQGLEFGPRWGTEESKHNTHPSEKAQKRPIRYEQRNRRPVFKKRSSESAELKEQKFERKPFKPVVDVLLYPNDQAFKALASAIQNSKITYQLFEIASLILEKQERFVVVIKLNNNPKIEEGQLTQLFMSVPDRLPFGTEEGAIQHVFAHYLDIFLEKKDIEIEAPKGNFTHVSRSLITGEILGPSNYHKYQHILQNHYQQHGKNMPYEKFLTRLETVKDKEVIDAWLEKMKHETHYILKDVPEGQTPPTFDHFEAARHHLLAHFKDKIVKSTDTLRFSGKAIETLLDGPIKRSVLMAFEQQKRFPLETANNLRGRLRRLNFSLYKKGSKGISYVSSVKRNFRTPQTVFTSSIQSLIEWLEKHPDTLKMQLPYLFLGLEAPKVKQKSRAAIPEESLEGTEAEEQKLETLEEPTMELTAEQEAQIRQIILDLRWLISEGYVIEYSNSKLQVVPILVQNAPKDHEGDIQETEAMECDSPEEESINGGVETSSAVDPFLSEEILENEGGPPVSSISEGELTK